MASDSPSAASNESRTTIAAGDALSCARVAAAPSGNAVSLRGGRGPRVVLRAHSATCERCRDFVRGLIADGAAVRDWSARISVVVPDAISGARALHTALDGRVQVLADPDGTLGLSCAELVIADEWGEVYFATQIGADHAFPEPDEVAEWARFIAIQCPECEGPEGDWRTL